MTTAPPTLRQVDSTRERILMAAAALLSRNGYADTHLTEIAILAQLKPPAVYYYFDSRDDLIAAVLREGQQRVREYVVAALGVLDPTATAATRVATAVDAHLRVQLELSDFARAVVRTSSHVPPAMRAEIAPQVEAYHDLWRDLLSRAERDGALRPGLDLTVARMLLIGALNWTTEWRTPDHAVDDVIKDARSVAMAALFVTSTPPHI